MMGSTSQHGDEPATVRSGQHDACQDVERKDTKIVVHDAEANDSVQQPRAIAETKRVCCCCCCFVD